MGCRLSVSLLVPPQETVAEHKQRAVEPGSSGGLIDAFLQEMKQKGEEGSNFSGTCYGSNEVVPPRQQQANTQKNEKL